MDKLADILSAAGVDASTLDVIFQADMETIHRLTVPGAQAIEMWEKLRGLAAQTGCWPVLLGDDANLAALQDQLKRLRYPRAVSIREEAATIDPLEWFENRRLDEIDELERGLEEKEDMGRWAETVKRWSAEGPYRGMPQGPGPAAARPNRLFSTPLESRMVPLPSVHIGLASTACGWQAPAYLRYGAWDECPSAAEHVALFRYWDERYGAEVVAMADDVVEMKVARPPADRDAALELAGWQYLYCRGLVTRGVKTLQNLAAALLGGTVWFFWWPRPGEEKWIIQA